MIPGIVASILRAALGFTGAQQQKLTASDAAADDQFGISVAIDADTAIVGAYFDDDTGASSGSAYVFTRSGSVWTEQQKLTASDAAAGDQFGISVGVSGDTVIIGSNLNDDAGSASGSAYVFTRSGSVWTEQQKLTASDAAGGDSFGEHVSIHNESVIISAHGNDDAGSASGSVYVFTRSGTVWTEQQKLTASDAAGSDFFGTDVDIHNDTVIIGADGADGLGTLTGAAYVFTRSGSVWTEQQILIPSDDNTNDRFGKSVGISGDTVVVGAYNSTPGVAYVFTRSGSVWTEQQILLGSDTIGGDFFGFSVSISGDSIVVGDYTKTSTTGAAYMFTRSGAVWTEQYKLTASDGATVDVFGEEVAISNNTVISGARLDDDAGSASGSAYVFV